MKRRLTLKKYLMKTKATIFAILFANASQAYSQQPPTVTDYLLDIGVYRPAGLIMTAMGSLAFAATLPTSLAASVFSLDEFISDAGKDFVVKPAEFTFTRPLGSPADSIF